MVGFDIIKIIRVHHHGSGNAITPKEWKLLIKYFKDGETVIRTLHEPNVYQYQTYYHVDCDGNRLKPTEWCPPYWCEQDNNGEWFEREDCKL